MIPYRYDRARVSKLKLGYHTDGGVDFDWKPYDLRNDKAREDYDRLEASIRAEGITCPLITYCGHVLIGMRRAEIAVKLGILEVDVVEILDDVSTWATADLPKLKWLQARVGGRSY